MITVFRTGEFDYSDEGIDKPVRYTIDNLIEIASRTSTIDVTNEHTDEVIGKLSNFIVEDGLLKTDEPNNLEISGKGLSPVLKYDLIDCGDYYEPTNVIMPKIGLTKTPRTQIVYNSISPKEVEVDNSMDDTEIQKLVKRNNELQEEIGVLKNQNKQLSKAIKDKDKEIKGIKDSYSDVDDKIKEYDGLKEIESNYNKLISSKRDDLIHQIAGDNKEIAKKLADKSIDDLELHIELLSRESDNKGLTPHQADEEGGLDHDGNDPSPTDDGDPTGEEMVEFYEENFGEKPSFINE